MSRPLIVLSPHLDDAALSCGGRIARAVDAGRRVVVATLFTQDEPLEPPSKLAADLRRWWSLPAGKVMKSRREEDLEACRRLGAEALHLDLPEAPYRTGARGAILYPDLKTLYGELALDDLPWRARIADTISGFVREHGDDLEILGPLGVGHHVDHLLVRDALLLARPEAALYEEFPYTEWSWFAVRRAFAPLGGAAPWSSDSLPLDAGQLERRRQAILAYTSQLPTLFRTEGRLDQQLRRALRRSGGERLWRRR